MDFFLLWYTCSGSPKETLKQKKMVAKGYPDGAIGHFLHPGRGLHSYFFVRHTNFKNFFNKVKTGIKRK